MKKKDLILAGGICALALVLWLAAQFFLTGDHRTIRITVDGELYGEYALEEDQVIAVGETNVCEIKAGRVKMIEADCPDHLCMHQKAIDAGGGTIVCLPNRVVIEAGKDESGGDSLDAVA